MNLSGLVSITFRKLRPEAMIELVKQAGLSGVEWGGDIHVPHGDLVTARRVRRWASDAGILTVCYGSYYRAGHPAELDFESVLATALALGSPSIRIWAGKQGSTQADEGYRMAVQTDVQRVVRLARREGVRVVLEYHGNTLTDTSASAVDLLKRCGDDAPGCLWQPPVGSEVADNVKQIEAIHPWFAHSHVFAWKPREDSQVQRLPLQDHFLRWQQYFNAIAHIPGDHFALLEFVADDAPEQFLLDAKCLLSLLSAFPH